MSASPEPITQNKARPRKLPKKCWREEYIRILEKYEYPAQFRPHDSEPKKDLDKMLARDLLHDLEDAGLIRTSQISPSISYPVCITYFGRLELDRLKSMRTGRRLMRTGWAAIVFAAGIVFKDLWPHLKTLVVSFFS